MKRHLFSTILAAAALAAACGPLVTNPGNIHESETLTVPATWTGDHLIKGDLTVNAKLTLDACAKLEVESDATIVVADGGSIVAQGTIDCPVTITAANLAPGPGDWRGIEIYSSASSDSAFDYTEIAWGGDADGAVWLDEGARAAFRNVNVVHTGDVGLEFGWGAELAAFEHVSIADTGSYAIELGANEVGSLSDLTATDIGRNDGMAFVFVNGTVSRQATWNRLGVPYYVSNLLVNAPLQIAPGVRLAMRSDATITVQDGGAFVTHGTAELPVVLTSANASPVAGDWRGVEIYATASNDNAFDHTNIEWGGDNDGAVWVEEGARAAFRNVSISHTGDIGMEFGWGADIAAFENVSIADTGSFAIEMGANEVGALTPLTTSEIGRNDGMSFVYVNGTLERAQTWKDVGLRYYIQNLSVSGGLTLEPGVHLAMRPGVTLETVDGGAIQAQGTPEAPVVFESSKPSPAAGDWGELDVYATSSPCTFSYTEFKHGGGGGYGALWVEEGADVTLSHAVFSENQGCDVSANNPVTDDGSTFSYCN